MLKQITIASVGLGLLAPTAVAHDTSLTVGCFTRDTAPYIEGQVRWTDWPVPNGPRLFAEFEVDGQEQDTNLVPLTRTGSIFFRQDVGYGDHAVRVRAEFVLSGRLRVRELATTINCPAPPPPPDEEQQPTPAPTPSTPELVPQPGNPIEPHPVVITPRPDRPPVKRVPLKVRKQVQVVRAVGCVLGPNARRSYTVRQIKVTWSRGGKVVRTKFSKRFVVRGKMCSQPAVTG